MVVIAESLAQFLRVWLEALERGVLVVDEVSGWRDEMDNATPALSEQISCWF
jgi:hypothetical protein